LQHKSSEKQKPFHKKMRSFVISKATAATAMKDILFQETMEMKENPGKNDPPPPFPGFSI
jgi:hypothetical protein